MSIRGCPRNLLALVPRFELGNPLGDHLPHFIERHGTALIGGFDAAIDRGQGFRIYLDFLGYWNLELQVNHTPTVARFGRPCKLLFVPVLSMQRDSCFGRLHYSFRATGQPAGLESIFLHQSGRYPVYREFFETMVVCTFDLCLIPRTDTTSFGQTRSRAACLLLVSIDKLFGFGGLTNLHQSLDSIAPLKSLQHNPFNPGSRNLLGPSAQNMRDSLEQDLPIEPKRPVVDILHVQPHPRLKIQGVPPGDCPQTRQSRAHP